jgi:hypothetical protein
MWECSGRGQMGQPMANDAASILMMVVRGPAQVEGREGALEE